MEKGEDFVVIDTRNPQEWANSEQKIPEAIRVSADDIDQALSRIPKDKPIVAYCT
jgi:rhodanese-related sulfurtransferase